MMPSEISVTSERRKSTPIDNVWLMKKLGVVRDALIRVVCTVALPVNAIVRSLGEPRADSVRSSTAATGSAATATNKVDGPEHDRGTRQAGEDHELMCEYALVHILKSVVEGVVPFIQCHSERHLAELHRHDTAQKYTGAPPFLGPEVRKSEPQRCIQRASDAEHTTPVHQRTNSPDGGSRPLTPPVHLSMSATTRK